MTDDQGYYTAKQIADKLGLSKRRITQFMQSGQIEGAEKASSLFGSYWRAPIKNADKFIREYKKTLK